MTLSTEDISFILESLKYTRKAFDNYKYDDYATRRERLDELERVVEHVRAFRDTQKAEAKCA